MKGFSYNGKEVTAQELAAILKPKEKELGCEIYASGKALYFDYGFTSGGFRQRYYNGNWGKHWTTVALEKVEELTK